MRYIYKLFFSLLHKRRGRRDCTSTGADKKIAKTTFSELKSCLIEQVNKLTTKYDVNSKYKIETPYDIRKIAGMFNERIDEIQKIFQHEAEQILSWKSVFFHWTIILILFSVDGIITRSILDTLFINLATYELDIIVVSFIVILSILINLTGKFFKTKDFLHVLRWPITALMLIVFLLLTFVRVSGISGSGITEFDYTIYVQNDQLYNKVLLFGLIFTIYLLTFFVGVYFGFKDTYKNPIIFNNLRIEYWERKTIVNKIKLKKENYEIKRSAYKKGWYKRKYFLSRREKKFLKKVRKPVGAFFFMF